MKLHNIVICSLKRKKSKTLFLVLGMILAIASVVSLLTIAENVNKATRANLDEFGANIVITPKSENLGLSYGGLNLGNMSITNNILKTSDIAELKKIKNKKNISIISPKLLNFATVKGNNTIIAGIDFSSELKLKKWWKINGKPIGSKNEAIIGFNTSKKLNLNINDRFNINSEEFAITGILSETGSQDDDLILIDLKKAQLIFNKSEELSLIELAALCYDCPIEEIVSQSSRQLPNADVKALRQTIDIKMAAMNSFEKFSIGISVLIMVVSVMIVFSNVNANVNERKAEIGLFSAIGFSKSNITYIILLEILFVSIVAGILGYFWGHYSAKTLAPIISSNSEIEIHFEPLWLLASISLSIITGLISSAYPIYKASLIDPTVAFRAI